MLVTMNVWVDIVICTHTNVQCIAGEAPGSAVCTSEHTHTSSLQRGASLSGVKNNTLLFVGSQKVSKTAFCS